MNRVAPAMVEICVGNEVTRCGSAGLPVDV